MTFIPGLPNILSHVGVIRNPVKDSFSHISSYTSITTTHMFAFQDDEASVGGEDRVRTHTMAWKVLLPATVVNTFGMGWQIANVKRTDGTTVLSEGTIAEIGQFEHWSEGLQLFVATLARN